MSASSPKPAFDADDPILPLVRWLFAVASLVGLIVIVGGITRLTESGLSITQWKPITGTIPPLTQGAWLEEFEAYKQIPQYTEVNGPAGMSLAEYKNIYFWEWFHRLLARLSGLAFALPLVWFWVKDSIPQGYKPRLLILLALGGFQGVIGWWMVTSGLSQDVKVSHFRLAVHLIVALFTLGALIWTALDLNELRRGQPPARLTRFSLVTLTVLLIQLVLGALVAGLRAGYVSGAGWFNWDAWPLMQGRLYPAGVEWASGVLKTLTSDPYLTHFLHRWWAFVVVIALVIMARKLRTVRRDLSVILHSVFGTQILLGIATIWSGITIWLAVSHQLVGAVLVATTVWAAHVLGRKC